MGQKNVYQDRLVFEYEITKGPKKGWVNVTAWVRQGEPADVLSKLRFTADVHKSGEIRNIQYAGDVMPEMGDSENQMPPEAKKMMEDSYRMIPESYKALIFWFPELPEHKLEIGDEFDAFRKTDMDGSGAGMQTASMTKQVFTLEEVSKGLAYFSVKERSITKTKGMPGGQTEMKMAGKGDAIFDIGQGMWIELTDKSRAKVNSGPAAGTQTIMTFITKYEMEPK